MGTRRGLGERMIFELKEEKEHAGKETEKRAGAKTKALKWKRTWFVRGPVGRHVGLKPGKAWEPSREGLGPGRAAGLHSMMSFKDQRDCLSFV